MYCATVRGITSVLLYSRVITAKNKVTYMLKLLESILNILIMKKMTDFQGDKWENCPYSITGNAYMNENIILYFIKIYGINKKFNIQMEILA